MARMKIVEPFLWECHDCGARHDERPPLCAICHHPMLWSGEDGSPIHGWYCNVGHLVFVKLPGTPTDQVREAAVEGLQLLQDLHDVVYEYASVELIDRYNVFLKVSQGHVPVEDNP